MKLALLYSLLIYELLKSCEATVDCTSLDRVNDATSSDIEPGYKYVFFNRDFSCHESNVTYSLYHQDHYTGELKLISTSQNFIHVINVQLHNSGVYCTHKSCSAAPNDSCCIRIQSKLVYHSYTL